MSRLRRIFRRVPLACWACAAIAFANGAMWAVITPMWQVPDEIDHFSYAQYISEYGDLPGGPAKRPELYSPELAQAAGAVPWNVEGRPTWYARDGRLSKRALEADHDPKPGSVGAAAINNQPLYYAVEAIPYRIGHSAFIFDRVYMMRLLSALFAALTTAFCFLFVREMMPRPGWAATVGALVVAFQPMFGFISGGINNDNLLWTCSAALIYLVARALRRGLTPWLGVAIGAAALAGVLTKTNFIGLLPGVALGVALAAWRTPAPRRRAALTGALAAAGVLLLPLGAWVVASQSVFDRGLSTATAGFASSRVSQDTNLTGHLSYIWQVFLPRLPGMSLFPTNGGQYPLWNPYFQSFVGRFGWLSINFPMWVNWMALGIFGGVFALVAAGLWRLRAAVRAHWMELVVFLAILVGYLGLVEAAAYRFQAANQTAFEQLRYLLPLLPFYALLIAVAARGAGRRWGQAVGALLVTLAVAHTLFSMILVTSHYYT